MARARRVPGACPNYPTTNRIKARAPVQKAIVFKAASKHTPEDLGAESKSMSFPGELDRQHWEQYGAMYPSTEKAAERLAQKGPFDPDSSE